MIANINAKKSLAALLAAVMVICAMAVVMSEPAQAETTVDGGESPADMLSEIVALGNPIMGMKKEFDLSTAVVFDGSTLTLADDTVYLVKKDTTVDLTDKTLTIGAGSALVFEGTAKIALYNGKIIFKDDAVLAVPGWEFFQPFPMDTEGAMSRTLTCPGAISIDTTSNGFKMSSTIPMTYVVENIEFTIDNGESKYFPVEGSFAYAMVKTDELSRGITFSTTARSADGSVEGVSTEAYSNSEGTIAQFGFGSYECKIVSEGKTTAFGAEKISVILNEDMFNFLKDGKYVLGMTSAIQVTATALHFSSESKEQSTTIDLQSDEKASATFAATILVNKDSGEIEADAVADMRGSTLKICDGELTLTAKHAAIGGIAKKATVTSMINIQAEGVAEYIQLAGTYKGVALDHSVKNATLDVTTKITKGVINEATLKEAFANMDGKASAETFTYIYGTANMEFSSVNFVLKNGISATADSYKATGVVVDGKTYSSSVAVSGDKLPAMLNGTFGLSPFKYTAGINVNATGGISMKVATGKITLGNEVAAVPLGTIMTFDKPIVISGEINQAVKAGDSLTVTGSGTITIATDAKDVTKGDVIDISNGNVVITEDVVNSIPGNDVILKDNGITVTIPKSAMDKMIGGNAVSLSVTASKGVTSYTVLEKLSEADREKVKQSLVINVDASTAAVTDDLGNISIVIPVDLQQLGMKKSAISAYYNNNGNLEKVRATYYEENGQGYVKMSTTHFSEYFICEELEQGQKDNTIVHILASLIVAVVAIAALLVLRENNKGSKA